MVGRFCFATTCYWATMRCRAGYLLGFATHLVSSSFSLFSPLSKPADWAIYFACVNFFLFSNWAKLSQDLLDRFSRFFLPNERYLCECWQYRPFFPIPQGTLPLQPILCTTFTVYLKKLHLSSMYDDHNATATHDVPWPAFSFGGEKRKMNLEWSEPLDPPL